MTLQEKYESLVIKQEGCWDWKKYKKPEGYGYFRFKDKRIHAHRVSWLLHKGEIPPKMMVLHKCDNPACSNPDHLFLGTNLDNIRDMLAKGRHKYFGQKGEKNHMAILKESQVRDIREMLSKGMKNITISRIMNVSASLISVIKRNVIWRHLS